MLGWLTSDGKVTFVSMALRSFAYIAIGVAFPIYLTLIGYDVTIIGLLVTFDFLSGAIFTAFSSVFADRIGRKRSLLLFSFYRCFRVYSCIFKRCYSLICCKYSWKYRY